MIDTIGCLSYTPLGYGTPQIVYLLRDLVRCYPIPEVDFNHPDISSCL